MLRHRLLPKMNKKNSKNSSAKSPLKKRTASISRWLHIYLSMVSFALLLFFAVTGLTLNHPGWFADQEQTTDYKGQLNVKWTNSPDTAQINKLQVVEFFRSQHGIKGALKDFRIDEDEISLSFKGPGYASDAFITRETGAYELSETKMGTIAVLNDLHKGRDSGKGWSRVIDISAIFMTLVSLTGLILMLFLKRKRTSGLVIAAAGLLVAFLIYKILVP